VTDLIQLGKKGCAHQQTLICGLFRGFGVNQASHHQTKDKNKRSRGVEHLTILATFLY